MYEPLVREGFEWVNTVDDADYERFRSFDGTPLVDNWTPVRVQLVRAIDRRQLRESDFPWLGSHALILRELAIARLQHLIAPCAEILPLEADDGANLFVLNVLKVIDALDEERSGGIIRVPNTDRIALVRQPYFHEERIRGIDLFRLPFRSSPTYASQEFVDAVAVAGLLGLDFNRVWPSPDN